MVMYIRSCDACDASYSYYFTEVSMNLRELIIKDLSLCGKFKCDLEPMTDEELYKLFDKTVGEYNYEQGYDDGYGDGYYAGECLA